MASLAKAELEALREKIAAIEKRPAFAEGAAMQARQLAADVPGGLQPELAELLAVPPGIVHEIFADEQRNSGTSLGFAFGMSRDLMQGERQALLYLQLDEQVQELGLPYAIGFQQFGLDPEKLVIGRIRTTTELLWAMEEAIACRAVAGVIADIAGHQRALDFTVSRRLSLRAAAAGTSVFLLRYGRGREASAAKLRWRVAPSLSGEREFDASAPGMPRFLVEIEKRRLGKSTQRAEGTQLILDWTENGFVSVEPRQRLGTPLRRNTPAPHPQFTALGDGLSQAG